MGTPAWARGRERRLAAITVTALAVVVLAAWAALRDGGSGDGPRRPGVSGTLGSLRVSDAYALESLVDVAVVYFSVNNSGTTDELLTAVVVDADLAGAAAVHETVTSGGASTMRPLAVLPVPAGATVRLETGGLHLMLEDLRQALAPGERVTLTLRFRDAGDLALTVPVISYAEAALLDD